MEFLPDAVLVWLPALGDVTVLWSLWCEDAGDGRFGDIISPKAAVLSRLLVGSLLVRCNLHTQQQSAIPSCL